MTCHKIGMIARIRSAACLWVSWVCWCLVVTSARSATNAPTSATGGPRSQPIRLAIGGFATPTDDASLRTNEDKLIDVLTAQLSQGGHFEMVERREIDSVVKEMSLSLAGSQRTNAITIGKLLRADWLLVGSLSNVHGTNSIIVKIVDARTGIILDLSAFSINGANLSDFATSIAAFVENSAARLARMEQRIYIGIGGFADLGVNHRYPDFRKQLQAALENNYKGTRFTVVERTMVEPLLTRTSPESWRPGRRRRNRARPRNPHFCFWTGRINPIRTKNPKLISSCACRKSGGNNGFIRSLNYLARI